MEFGLVVWWTLIRSERYTIGQHSPDSWQRASKARSLLCDTGFIVRISSLIMSSTGPQFCSELLLNISLTLCNAFHDFFSPTSKAPRKPKAKHLQLLYSSRRAFRTLGIYRRRILSNHHWQNKCEVTKPFSLNLRPSAWLPLPGKLCRH